MIVTATVAVTAVQPPLDGVVYVTVYVPAVLVLGVIAPVLASIVILLLSCTFRRYKR